MSDRLIDVAEAARLLTLAEGTVRNMAEAGRLPVVRPAGTRRVRVSESSRTAIRSSFGIRKSPSSDNVTLAGTFGKTPLMQAGDVYTSSRD